MTKDRDFEKEYKQYESKASEYLNDKDKADDLLKKAMKKANDKKGALSEIWEKLQLMFEIFRAWIKGEYKEIPTGSIIMIIAGIIYFVSPVDLVPDFIVALGLVDDATVIGIVIKKISDDLERFKIWKEQNI